MLAALNNSLAQDTLVADGARLYIAEVVHLQYRSVKCTSLLHACAVVLLTATNDAFAAYHWVATQRAVLRVGDLIDFHLGLSELPGALIARTMILHGEE